MKISIRPGKTALFRYLRKFLRPVDGDVCVDAACGNMKNRDLFSTERYYGLDVREDVIRSGLERCGDGFGIIGDLKEIDLPEASVDYLVSTNTLFWLEKETLVDVVSRMAKWVKRKGCMFIDVRNDDMLDGIVESLSTQFDNVEVIYYRNPLSQLFDRAVERRGKVSRAKCSTSRAYLALSYFASLLEGITGAIRKINADAIVKCSGRRNAEADREFSTDHLAKTQHPRIYDGRRSYRRGGRYVHFRRSIDTESVRSFFRGRAQKYDSRQPEVTTMYQDNNPNLALLRDREEKNVLLQVMAPDHADRVLDVGCGIGRWAEELSGRVMSYHGTDVTPELIEIARKRCSGMNNVSFQVIPAEAMAGDTALSGHSFSLIIIAGVLHYVNDESLEMILRGVAACSDANARLLIRGPFAVEKRLTLDNIWSSELNAEYSAIYRTRREFAGLLRDILPDYILIVDRPLYKPELNNRKETMQHMFLLQKNS